MPPQSQWRVQDRLANSPPVMTKGLLEPEVEAIPVRITIVQDDVETGWDDGALGFEETAVWFSGRACSFHISAPDILPGTYRLSRREAVTMGEALHQGLPLKYDSREVWVRIKILKVEDRNLWEDEETLSRAIQRLRSGTEGDGRSEYPPLAPRPGLLANPHPLARYRGPLWGLAIALHLVRFGFIGSLIGPLLGMLGTVLFIVATFVSVDPNAAKLRRIASEEATA